MNHRLTISAQISLTLTDEKGKVVDMLQIGLNKEFSHNSDDLNAASVVELKDLINSRLSHLEKVK